MIHVLLNTLPWLLGTFTSSESLMLKVKGHITADCGKPVTLHCEVSSPMSGLSIKHMEWSQSQFSYCSVDKDGHLAAQSSLGDFHCRYEKGNLSLHFDQWQAHQSESPFMCKVRSNQGIQHDYTLVETIERWEGVEATWGLDFPSCTFRQLCPAGDVDWFKDSQKITDLSLIVTEKRTEDSGTSTIYSYLKTPRRDRLYHCSLKSLRTGQYLTSAELPPQTDPSDTAPAHGPCWTSLGVLVGFVIEKYSH
ncbi:uncharacterized protein LOC117376581 [Periophthalmus magnuspinnatus]|uniref:uncharacterized protein LOC117376581 n=1 Tax=Periophthalmus magnuspinnatus TaxID=409849 RepID=UPI00145BD3A5|nr:uncharacterized protein LOC117376581 [Periophthalmus magnuspinnatus]